MIRFQKKPKNQKKSLVKEYIADMDTGGIRFPDSVKDKIKLEREKSHCNYSGLPSPYSYE